MRRLRGIGGKPLVALALLLGALVLLGGPHGGLHEEDGECVLCFVTPVEDVEPVRLVRPAEGVVLADAPAEGVTLEPDAATSGPRGPPGRG